MAIPTAGALSPVGVPIASLFSKSAAVVVIVPGGIARLQLRRMRAARR